MGMEMKLGHSGEDGGMTQSAASSGLAKTNNNLWNRQNIIGRK